MTLDAIRKSILDEAEENASSMEKESSKEAERIINDAESRAKQIMKDAEKDAEREAERLRKESKAAAEIEAGSMLLQAQGEAIERAVGETMEQLAKEARKANMRKLVEQAIREFAEASGGREIVVRAGKKYADMVKGVDARVEYDNDVDGFVLSTSDSKISLNATVESLLESQSDAARRLAYDELFRAGSKGAKPAPEKAGRRGRGKK